MGKTVGLWIDHRKAVIVVVSDKGDETRVIESNVEKQPARLCVQRRLACSAGDRPAGERVRNPVAWIAGWRVTNTLKPID
ncbi:MAG: hypothetical protein MUO63_01175, partial [Desulfobulbaceae bacterium]|nr:hypothetical protein [Desulfobulbaceae bacterium]